MMLEKWLYIQNHSIKKSQIDSDVHILESIFKLGILLIVEPIETSCSLDSLILGTTHQDVNQGIVPMSLGTIQ